MTGMPISGGEAIIISAFISANYPANSLSSPHQSSSSSIPLFWIISYSFSSSNLFDVVSVSLFSNGDCSTSREADWFSEVISPGKFRAWSILSNSSVKPQSAIIWVKILSIEESWSNKWFDLLSNSYSLTWELSYATLMTTIGSSMALFLAFSSLTRQSFCITFRWSGQLLRSMFRKLHPMKRYKLGTVFDCFPAGM